MQSIGTDVRVGDSVYQITNVRWGDACGSKFAGKARISLLRRSDGTTWEAYGKRVAHNSRLTPVGDHAEILAASARRAVREALDGRDGAYCRACGVVVRGADGRVVDTDTGPAAECIVCPVGVDFRTAYPVGTRVQVTTGFAAGTVARVIRVTDAYPPGVGSDTQSYYAGRSYVVMLAGYGERPMPEEYVTPEDPADIARYAVNREPAPAEPGTPADAMTLARSLRFGALVSGVTDGRAFGGYVCAAPVDAHMPGGVPAVALTLAFPPVPGRGAPAYVTAGTRLTVLPVDPSDAATLSRVAHTLRLDPSALAQVAAWCAEHGHPVAAPVDTLPVCGCPVASVEMAGPFGHRVGCVHHAEPGDVPAPASVATVTATESEAIVSAVVSAPVAQVDALPAAGEPFTASVHRDALADALALAVWATPSRTCVPALAGVMVSADGAGTLTLGVFDYETSVRYALAADGAGAGRVLVNAKAFCSMVKTFPKVKRPTAAQVRKGATLPAGAGMVTLTANDAALTVTYGTVRLSLPTLPAEDHPTFPEPGMTVAQVDAGALAASVARVTVAASRDETLPVLTGVQLTTDTDGRNAHLAATDRYRLAVDVLPWTHLVPDGTPAREHIAPALIPAKVLSHLGKTFDKIGGTVTVGQTRGADVGAACVTLACGPITVTTRCGDIKTFPNVLGLFGDDCPETATVDSHTLAGAVGRVMSAADRTSTVRLALAADAVTVVVGGNGEAEAAETVPATTSTGAIGWVIRFNGTYLIDVLRAVGSGPVTIGMINPRKPAVITSDALPGYRHLIMPVRIGDGAPAASTPAPAAPSARIPADTDTDTDTESTEGPAMPRTANPAPAASPEPAAPVTGAPAGESIPTDGGEAHGPAPVAQVDAARSAEIIAVGADRAARVREIITGGTWSTGVIHTGTGRSRRPMAVDVLTLPDGRLDRETYTAIRGALRPLGGSWHKETKGFVFEPAATIWDGTARGARTRDPRDAVAEWLACATYVAQMDADASADTPAPVGAAPDVVSRAFTESADESTEVAAMPVTDTTPDPMAADVFAIARDALIAFTAGDRTGALTLIDQGESIAPDYRINVTPDSPAGFGWADVRAHILAVDPAPAADTTEPAPVADPVADVPAVTATPAPAPVVSAPGRSHEVPGHRTETVHVPPTAAPPAVAAAVTSDADAARVPVVADPRDAAALAAAYAAAVNILTAERAPADLTFTLPAGVAYRPARKAVNQALWAATRTVPVLQGTPAVAVQKIDDRGRTFRVPNPAPGADPAEVARAVAAIVYAVTPEGTAPATVD